MFLLYADAVLAVLFGQIFSFIGLALAVASGVAAFQIANDRRWGYKLGVGVAGFQAGLLALSVLLDPGLVTNIGFLILAIFPVALLVALIHPVSRQYQQIWFE